ncbi:MAG: ASPIC/UnbV domain-containing protein, partial [Acidobacteriota bacterium]
QMVHSGSSYCSQSELTLTYGLGRHDRAEQVEIEWPGGKTERIRGLAANQLHSIREAKGVVESLPLPLTTTVADGPRPTGK